MRTAVVAIGGNALIGRGERGTAEEELGHARVIARSIVDMIAEDWSVVVTHGNGPQVGFIARRAEMTPPLETGLPAITLDQCVAETQGSLGYLIVLALSNELRSRGMDADAVAVVTRTVVDAADPAFRSPAKPIGPREDRRLVASPEPLAIPERRAIEELLYAGFTVVAAGGGGIPIVRTTGDERGVEAVVDKDLASALLASGLRADLLALCTDVPAVARAFGKPEQRWLHRLSEGEAEELLATGELPPGSMGPKVRAALRFVRASGGWGEALITSIERLTDALAGRSGTRIVPEPILTPV